jgi:phospholipase/carboxylesterase
MKSLWMFLGVFLIAGFALGENPYSTEYVQGHRCLVVAPKDLPPGAPVILLLHGYGTNGDEMLGVSTEFQLPPCILVLPDGPLPAGRSSFTHAWYNRLTHSRRDIENSRRYLFAVMDYFSREYSTSSGPDDDAPLQSPVPVSPGKMGRPVVIMGFSQGAVMSLEAGVNYKGNIAAVVSMNGYMGDPEKTLAHPAASRRTPILLVHGTLDPIVQEEMTEATLRALRKAGYRPISKPFPIGHKMTAGTIQAVSDFLQLVFYHP